jgi:deoxyribonuclease-4
MMIIGAHVKREKTIVATFEKLLKHSGDGPSVLQIFVCNPRSGRITEENILKYKEEATRTNLKGFMRRNNCRLWIHSPYTINLARPFAPDAYWVTTMTKQLQIADYLGANGVIVHLGHAQEHETGVKEMKKAIEWILRHYKGTAKLVLETSSGTGSEILADLRALRDFVREIGDVRLKVCIDTAHVWGAGYDIMEALRFVGRKWLAVVHFNNSLSEFGSRLNRHECLAGKKGEIPFGIMKNVAQLCAVWKVPLIMETPRECWKKEIILFRENRERQRPL